MLLQVVHCKTMVLLLSKINLNAENDRLTSQDSI